MKNDLIIPPLDVMPDIPIGYPHPGCFGFKRSHDIHTGVDLYAPYGTPVKAMEDGIIVKIAWFTGEVIGMPWWENTRAVYIEGKTGVFCYGEIMEDSSLQEGETIKQGTYFGYVINVLKKYKGRPMSMLHLELYDHGYTDIWGVWGLGSEKPEHLKDPTPYLLNFGNGITADPYSYSNLIYSNRYKK